MPRSHRCLTLALICALTACTRATREAHRAAPDTSREAMALQGDLPPLAVANDNRTPAGELRDGVLELRLEARQVAWHPENDPDNTVTVLAFAEEDRPARWLADLVLLDANPLGDIRNTRSLEVVISEGRVVNREPLLGERR